MVQSLLAFLTTATGVPMMRSWLEQEAPVSVSTNAATVRSELPRTHRSPRSLRAVRLVVLLVIATDLSILVLGVAESRLALLESWVDIALWAGAVAAIGIAAIQTPSGQTLGMDMPVLLAAGYVFGPIAGGAIAFVGYIDLREFRGRISLDRALFNRAQTSLSVMAAAAVYSLVIDEVSALPGAALGALAAVAIDCLVNYGLVGGIMALHERTPPTASLSRLRLGSTLDFLGTYAAFGLLSLILAEVYWGVGVWALLLFAMPVVLARRGFAQGQRLEGAMNRINIQGEALRQTSDRIADERRDERLAIAAGLHDDVLPPLFKVHLMGQVLRQELSTGRLLAMEDDLPELLRATDEASGILRSVIRNLRTSPLGAGGLAHTLQLLIRHLESETTMTFTADLEDVRGTPVAELLTYQVAREVLRNAVRHSKGSSVSVTLRRDAGDLRLQVEDDGTGFALTEVDQQNHFGLALMRERIELSGGMLQIESSAGEGTRIVARLPSAEQGHK
jgi:signal transduction histidine kinase